MRLRSLKVRFLSAYAITCRRFLKSHSVNSLFLCIRKKTTFLLFTKTSRLNKHLRLNKQTNLCLLLQLGDQIMVLNGHCLRETTHEQAVKWFRDSRTKMDVVISRMVESKLQKGMQAKNANKRLLR